MWKNVDVPRSDVPLLSQLNPVVKSPTTPGQFDHLPQSNLVVKSPTTSCQFDASSSPLIEPSGRDPYYTRSVWHVEECRHTQVRCTLPLPQSNIMVQSPTTPGQFDMSKNADVLRSDVPLLYQLNLVVKSPTTPGQFDPLPHSQLDLAVQRSTTPGQFDMWKNTDIPRSDVPPPWIKPIGKEHYYTRSVWHVEECRCTEVRCTPPPSIKPSGKEPYYTRSVWHVKECRCTPRSGVPLLS